MPQILFYLWHLYLSKKGTMIHIPELTVNNLLQDDNDTIWMVVLIDKENELIKCKALETSDTKTFKPDELNPIILNKNWLKRFRFTYGLISGGKRISETGWHSPSVVSRRTNVYKINLEQLHNGGFTLLTNHSNEYDFFYVHELQNYLKLLAGKDIKFLSTDMKKYIKL